MYSHLLLPTDGSKLSNRAIDEGLALARQVGARVTVLTVVEPLRSFSASSEMVADVLANFEKTSRENAGKVLQAAVDKAGELGVQIDTTFAHASNPYREIISTATNAGCDLIVMASHGRRGVDALLLGSVTQKVLTHSSIPVLVIRHEA